MSHDSSGGSRSRSTDRGVPGGRVEPPSTCIAAALVGVAPVSVSYDDCERESSLGPTHMPRGGGSRGGQEPKGIGRAEHAGAHGGGTAPGTHTRTVAEDRQDESPQPLPALLVPHSARRSQKNEKKRFILPCSWR